MSCPPSFHHRNTASHKKINRKDVISQIQFNEAINCITQQQNKQRNCLLGLLKPNKIKSLCSNHLIKNHFFKDNYRLGQVSVRYRDEMAYDFPKDFIYQSIQKKQFEPSFKIKKKSKRQKINEQAKKKYIKTPKFQRQSFQRLIRNRKRQQEILSLSVQQVMINRLKVQKLRDQQVEKQPLRVLCQYKRQMARLKVEFDRLLSR